MSLSGSSASRNSIWAITRFASSSSMKVGRKMIRSLSRREKMSNARSPRGVCSTTIGTRPIGDLLFISSPLCRDLRVGDQEVERHAVPDALAQSFQVAAFLHHTTEGRSGPLTGLRQLLDLGVDVGVGGCDRLLVGDRLQQEGPAHRLLGAGAELGDQLLVVPGHPLGIDALAADGFA